MTTLRDPFVIDAIGLSSGLFCRVRDARSGEVIGHVLKEPDGWHAMFNLKRQARIHATPESAGLDVYNYWRGLD